jgi:hypothetical protein
MLDEEEHKKISEGEAAEFDPLQIGVSKQQLIQQLQDTMHSLQRSLDQNELLRGQVKQADLALMQVTLEKKDEPGKRFDEGKIDYHLMPAPFLVEFAKLYTGGAIKYDPENWRKGMSYSRMIRCVWSHWLQWLCGIKKDPETGIHLCVVAAWNLCSLYMYDVHLKKEAFDDRQDLLSNTDFGCPEEFKALREKYQGQKDVVDVRPELETKQTQ